MVNKNMEWKEEWIWQRDMLASFYKHFSASLFHKKKNKPQMLPIAVLLCIDSIKSTGLINILDLLKEQEVRNRSVFVCAQSY